MQEKVLDGLERDYLEELKAVKEKAAQGIGKQLEAAGQATGPAVVVTEEHREGLVLVEFGEARVELTLKAAWDLAAALRKAANRMGAEREAAMRRERRKEREK